MAESDDTTDYFDADEQLDPTPPDWGTEITSALQEAHDSNSHTETDDPRRLHPSQIAGCRRGAFTSKMGITDDTDALGYFVGGTLVHELFEENLSIEGCVHEHPVEFQHDGLEIVGTCDFYDPFEHLVVDFKTRGGWYQFDPPKQSHVEQLTLYQAALADGRGPPEGQIVYVNRKNIQDVRPYPEDGNTISFDRELFEDLIEKAHDVREAAESVGVPDSEADIPFDKCGCYGCQEESLSL